MAIFDPSQPKRVYRRFETLKKKKFVSFVVSSRTMKKREINENSSILKNVEANVEVEVEVKVTVEVKVAVKVAVKVEVKVEVKVTVGVEN